MNKTALIESLMSTFVEEVGDHVRSFNRDLLALESGQGDPATLLQSLFRTAHNLKGASRAVDMGLIESACHGLEDILARARDGERPLDAAAFEILFATADAIDDAGTRLKEKQSLAASPLAALASRLVRQPRRRQPAAGAGFPSIGSTAPDRDGHPSGDARPPRGRHPPRQREQARHRAGPERRAAAGRPADGEAPSRVDEPRGGRLGAGRGLPSPADAPLSRRRPRDAGRRPAGRSGHRQIAGRSRACRGRRRDRRPRTRADGGGAGLRRAQLADGPFRRSGRGSGAGGTRHGPCRGQRGRIPARGPRGRARPRGGGKAQGSPPAPRPQCDGPRDRSAFGAHGGGQAARRPHHRLRRPERRAGGDRRHRRRTRTRPGADPRRSPRAGTAGVRGGPGSPGPRVPPRPFDGARRHRRVRPRRGPRRRQEPGERPPRHGGARVGGGRRDDVLLDRALDGHAHPGPDRGGGGPHVRAWPPPR